MRRRYAVVGGAVIVGLVGGGIGVYALFGGFDDISRARVGGGGERVVEIRLVDQGLGFDVRPDILEIEAGTAVVLDVVNAADGEHDLMVDGGRRTRVLAPGESERLDLGVVTDALDAWCTIGDHDVAGMTLDLRVIGRQTA